MIKEIKSSRRGGEEIVEGGLGNVIATIRPYEWFKHEGGLEEARKTRLVDEN